MKKVLAQDTHRLYQKDIPRKTLLSCALRQTDKKFILIQNKLMDIFSDWLIEIGVALSFEDFERLQNIRDKSIKDKLLSDILHKIAERIIFEAAKERLKELEGYISENWEEEIVKKARIQEIKQYLDKDTPNYKALVKVLDNYRLKKAERITGSKHSSSDELNDNQHRKIIYTLQSMPLSAKVKILNDRLDEILDKIKVLLYPQPLTRKND